jgi:DhnA family fructose-bisphosphate aldolase class Ia
MDRISRDCKDRGLPQVVHAYAKGELIKDDERYSHEDISYTVRAAVECGADVVKPGTRETMTRLPEWWHQKKYHGAEQTQKTSKGLP